MFYILFVFLLFLISYSLVLSLDMRRDVQEIFRSTPHEKQVMMFSATLSKEIRPVCKKFMQDVITLRHYLLSVVLLHFFSFLFFAGNFPFSIFLWFNYRWTTCIVGIYWEMISL